MKFFKYILGVCCIIGSMFIASSMGYIPPGNLTTTTPGVAIGNGINAINGIGTTVNISTADATHNGILSHNDWSNFNNTYTGIGTFDTISARNSALATFETQINSKKNIDTAMATVELMSNKGIPNGYADLDINAKVPTIESYVVPLPIFAKVATSGAYSDLSGNPTLSTVATSGSYSDLSGTPVLSTVATSGAYADLSGRPTLATVATSGAYSDLSGTPSLAVVATSGAYSNLSGTPNLGTFETITQATTDISTALSTTEFMANKAVANGYASLDANAKVPTTEAYYAVVPWITSGSNIYYSAGNVSVGTSSATSALTVSGTIETDGAGGLKYQDGFTQTSGKFTRTFIITAPNSTTLSSAPFWRVPYGITIQALHVLCVGGTSVIGQLWAYDNNGANGATVDSTNITALAGVNADQTSFSAPVVSSTSWLGWKMATITGSPTRLYITIEYTEN